MDGGLALIFNAKLDSPLAELTLNDKRFLYFFDLKRRYQKYSLYFIPLVYRKLKLTAAQYCIKLRGQCPFYRVNFISVRFSSILFYNGGFLGVKREINSHVQNIHVVHLRKKLMKVL